MPGPRSMTRSSAKSPSVLPVMRTRAPSGRVAQRVLHEVRDDPFEQARVRAHGRQVGGDVGVDGRAVRCGVVESARDDVVEPDRTR